MINKIIQTLSHDVQKCILTYLDDFKFFTETLEEHERVLMAVLEAFQNNGLLLKTEKSKHFQSQIDYFGFNISRQWM